MEKHLMIDIGGTNIKYGITTDGVNIEDKNKTPTEADKGFDHVLQKVEKIVEKFEGINLIAISQAGIIAEDSSIFFASEKKKGFTGRSFKKELEQKFKIQTFVVNDAKAAASYLAKHIEENEALSVVLGTGVGTSLICDRKVVSTRNGITGDIGLTIHGEQTLDEILSLSGLKKRIEPYGLEFSDFRHKWFENVEFINYLKNLAVWTYNFFVIYGASTIYFGGSLPYFGNTLLEELKNEILRFAPVLGKEIKVAYAPEGENANLLGALYEALKRRDKENVAKQ